MALLKASKRAVSSLTFAEKKAVLFLTFTAIIGLLAFLSSDNESQKGPNFKLRVINGKQPSNRGAGSTSMFSKEDSVQDVSKTRETRAIPVSLFSRKGSLQDEYKTRRTKANAVPLFSRKDSVLEAVRTQRTRVNSASLFSRKDSVQDELKTQRTRVNSASLFSRKNSVQDELKTQRTRTNSVSLFSKEDSVQDKVKIQGATASHNRRSKNAPRAIILWTTWRSGSNYIGELLAKAVPNTFYSIETLLWIGNKILHENDTKTSEARRFLQDVLHCRIGKSYQSQFDFLTQQEFFQQWNPYLYKNCTESCGDTAYVSKMCREANMHVAKVVRLSLKWAWQLLQDDDLDLQVIYLVRDPRATLVSRSHITFCGHPSCSNHKEVCSLIEDDLMVASKLQDSYPKKFKLIQYEKFSKDARKGLQDVMSFLGLHNLSQMQLDLLYPKKLSTDDLFSTKKNSSLMVNRWRAKTDFKIALNFQEACTKVIDMLGLRIFQSESEFKNLSLPLLLTNIT